jgi:dCTP deaminase
MVMLGTWLANVNARNAVRSSYPEKSGVFFIAAGCGIRWGIHRRNFFGQQPTQKRDRPSMAIKSDRWIRQQAVEHNMIAPFSEKQVREGVISYGLSSYGYDLRVSDEFKIFTNVNSAIIDPKAFDERSFVTVQAESVIVPPNSFALARSIEYFKIPRDVLTICVGKSTYARCGIIVNVTPFEPEWEGFVTLEISNTTPLPARIYANEGLCQILFFQSDEVCEVSYADRKGKYQNQQGIVLPKL